MRTEEQRQKGSRPFWGRPFLNRLDHRSPAALAIGLSLLIAALSAWYGASIRIDTRLRALLPAQTPSLVAIQAVTQAKGATDQLTIAVQCPDADRTQKLGQALTQRLQSWPEAEDLSFALDLTPFRDNLLYWMSESQLGDLRDALKDAKREAVAEHTRAGLTDVKIPGHAVAVDEDDWDKEYEDPQTPSPAPDDQKDSGPSLPDRIETMREKFLSDPRLRRGQAQAIWPRAWTKEVLDDPEAKVPWPTAVQSPVQNANGTIALITARMTRPPTDVAFVSELETRFSRMLDEISALDPNPLAAGCRAQVVGSYAISGDIDMIMVDLRNATALSIALVIVVLFVGFGTWRGLVVVVTPVLVSMGLTLALAKLIFGELNVLTAFLFAVLFGMGVDFSVHLYMQRLKGPVLQGWSERIQAHWRPLASTMLTTTGALLALCLGEFQAFREFGLISAIGVTTCFLVALILVPALDTLLGLPRNSAPKTPHAASRGMPTTLRVLLGLGIAAICALGLGELSFETNTRNLRAPKDPQKAASVIPYGEAQGNDRTSVPTILYSDDPQRLSAAVRELQDPQHKSWVKGVVSIETLLPQAQPEKHTRLVEIAELTQRLGEDPPRYGAALAALHKLSQADPIQAQELPEWTRAPFSTRDGAVDRIAHAHLRFAAHDLNEIQAVVRKLRAVLEPHQVMAATTSFVFADLGELITLDSKRLPALALGIIALCLWVDLRRLGPTLACLSILGLGLALSLALLGLLDIRINFFNLAVLPAVVGLGIDASIHLWHARGRNLGATGRASVVAGATTCAAFAGLLVASHPGLRSMAQVGLISIFACVGTAFLLLTGWQKR